MSWASCHTPPTVPLHFFNWQQAPSPLGSHVNRVRRCHWDVCMNSKDVWVDGVCLVGST